MPVHLSLLAYAALAVTAFVAGFIDAIGGGGGLLTVPMMALFGLDPINVLATNKLQSTFGSGSATLAYARAGHVDWRGMAPMAIASGVGAMVGVYLLGRLPKDLILHALPVALVLVALYFAFSPRVKDIDGHSRIPPAVFGFTIVPLIGAYDGVFGPGTGSFFMIGFVALCGFGVMRATAHTKFCNFASNVSALLAWIWAGKIVWSVGLVMGAAQVAGSRLGAHFVLNKGTSLVRPVLIVICLLLAARLAWQQGIFSF
ncbi:MAG: TSUP family transporter [Hyphomicrobiales bacterium]|nr:TSUP family transporter [Hyphomicrobiales bacterium]MDE2115429.1 TSUP family transporter [Hyphomicrobiales bacterium]